MRSWGYFDGPPTPKCCESWKKVALHVSSVAPVESPVVGSFSSRDAVWNARPMSVGTST